MKPFSINPWPLLLILLLCWLPISASAQDEEEEEEEAENVCVECHMYADEENLKRPVADWRQSVHKKAGVACYDCHGGDPDADEPMSPELGFLGKPTREAIPALCARCHADAKKMRPYNLKTDQYALYKKSVHGRRLMENNDQKVATCIDCHSNHAVFSRKDPRSPAFKSNIPGTCSKCHSNKAYMAEYKIPTNQYDEYLKSYHGRLLTEKDDPRVPTCVDCHGAHGATPPGTRAVADVCGNCHSVTAEYFSRSRHAQAMKKEGKPRCVDCHGNHFIPFPTSEKFTGGADVNGCRSCHKTGSRAYLAGETLKRLLDSVENSIARGRSEVANLKKKGGTGFEVSRLGDKLDDAHTRFIKTVAMTHTLDMPGLEKRINKISTITQYTHKKISSIYRELKIRYMGLVFTLVFLSLLIWAVNEKRKSL